MHPIIDGLFNKMLEERVANADRGASYEIYDIDGDIGALLDTVNCYYNNWAVKPIEELIKEYSGKTVGELRSRINDIISTLQDLNEDILDKIPVDYTEDRSLKKIVTYWEELSWQLTCYTKDYEATKEFVDPIVQTLAKRMAMNVFYIRTADLPTSQIIDDTMKAYLQTIAWSIGDAMGFDANLWIEACDTKEFEATQKIVDAHREEIEQYRNSQMALKKRLG